MRLHREGSRRRSEPSSAETRLLFTPERQSRWINTELDEIEEPEGIEGFDNIRPQLKDGRSTVPRLRIMRFSVPPPKTAVASLGKNDSILIQEPFTVLVYKEVVRQLEVDGMIEERRVVEEKPIVQLKLR